MYKIIQKERLHQIIYSMWIEAPQVAQSVQPGQFIILMIQEKGERIPLTVADFDRERGLIRIVFQVVGKTTDELSTLEEGDKLFSFIGPLGKKTEIEDYGTVVTVGGGTGIACIHPITRALKEAGNKVISIIGARSKDLIIMEEELKKASSRLIVTTDDGSYGRKGFVTQVLKELLDQDKSIKKVWTIGPAIMMKVTCETTRPYPVETIVSLNSIMVDGTGMCGSCRVTIGKESKFVCTDGPEFDGQLVDWEEFMNRLTRYKLQEKRSWEIYQEHTHLCTCGRRTN
ncbi:MAG TPA: sulfide/dihydroorotate dehydrogenase-like FAD/NAD-binding protein [Candidatus Atribacteria bacterium]|nr:sulfide/dihydroorotate dehydrogenase-like FAD/NAD-binding protein [Candidatus Atribacteria bacterium]